jgi:NAD+ kinase
MVAGGKTVVKFGLFPNSKKNKVSTVLSWLIHHLEEHMVKVYLPEEVARELNFPHLGYNMAAMQAEIQMGITLGGDGTLLTTARDLAAYGIPVCGINLGQLGFLTEVELPDLSLAIDKLIQGDYLIEERLMLAPSIIKQEEECLLPMALNDVVVSKGGLSRMIRLKLFLDGELTANYPADGLIIATSTGSTGYSLSAGGPIVNPSLRVMILTPICPHTLHSRSLVVGENEEIKVATQATHDDIVLTIDGQHIRTLSTADTIVVRQAPFSARLIRLGGSSYSQSLRSKLWRGDFID